MERGEGVWAKTDAAASNRSSSQLKLRSPCLALLQPCIWSSIETGT
jgi:hypothetical protein